VSGPGEPLAGRAGVVTGAAQGIGRALAEGLMQAGAHVALLDREADGVKAAAAELARAGAEVSAHAADVADAEAVSAAVGAAVERHGRLDFLVNNAGVRHIAPLMELDLAAWQATLDVNLTGTFNGIRAAVPHMLRQGGGAIVNVASVAGLLAFRNRAPYNVSKAGVIMLTKSVALELGAQGIRCNAVAPGVIETPLTRDYFADPELAATIRANTPAGRWGHPQDLVAPVVFLCGPGAEFVQGETLFVDGGWVAGKGY
jgi:NAD(P)-dependent dehydrogenase (short-subunit alcohol dehydrogenase family)